MPLTLGNLRNRRVRGGTYEPVPSAEEQAIKTAHGAFSNWFAQIALRPMMSASLGVVTALMSNRKDIEPEMIAAHTLLGFVWLYITAEGYAQAAIQLKEKQENLQDFGRAVVENILLNMLQASGKKDVSELAALSEENKEKFLKEAKKEFVKSLAQQINSDEELSKYGVRIVEEGANSLFENMYSEKYFSNYMASKIQQIERNKTLAAAAVASVGTAVVGAAVAATSATPTAGLGVLAAGTTATAIVGGLVNLDTTKHKQFTKSLVDWLDKANSAQMAELRLSDSEKAELHDFELDVFKKADAIRRDFKLDVSTTRSDESRDVSEASENQPQGASSDITSHEPSDVSGDGLKAPSRVAWNCDYSNLNDGEKSRIA